MPQSRITDRRRGQFKSACLKLQPIKLTVLFNSAWAELSNTDCAMSVHVYTAALSFLPLEPVCDQALVTNWFWSAAVYTCTTESQRNLGEPTDTDKQTSHIQ